MTKSNDKLCLVALRVLFLVGIPLIYTLLLASAYASEGGGRSGYFGVIYYLDFWVLGSFIVFWITQKRLAKVGLFFFAFMAVFCCWYTIIRLMTIYR